MRDAHRRLLNALVRRVEPAHSVTPGECSSREWASATFVGARHRFALTISGPKPSEAATRFADGLDAMEFEIPGHLVADIVVVERSDRSVGTAMTIEALTVEDY